jgi:hypothetical protein
VERAIGSAVATIVHNSVVKNTYRYIKVNPVYRCVKNIQREREQYPHARQDSPGLL